MKGQVWAGGLSFVEGVLKTSIGFAESVDKPNTEGRAVIRRRVRNDQVVNKRIQDENDLVADAQAIAVWDADVDVDEDGNPDESLKAGDANNLPVPGRENNAGNGEKWRDQATKTAFINNRKDAAQDAELGRGLYEWKNLEEEVIITNRDPSLSASVETAEENGYDIYVMLVRVNYEWRPVWVSCDNIASDERGF